MLLWKKEMKNTIIKLALHHLSNTSLALEHICIYTEHHRQISTNTVLSLHIKIMNRLECTHARILIHAKMTLIWLIRMHRKWIKVSIHGPNVAVVMVTLAKGWSQLWSSCWAKSIKHTLHFHSLCAHNDTSCLWLCFIRSFWMQMVL